MSAPPAPIIRDLLPPLLACLPTSFVSSKPPPSLLPLLSPILRQRVNYLSTAPGKDGWLSLLSWDSKRAAKLPAVVQSMDLEPHPVSGELELEEVRPAKYRRLDEETLQARLEVEQFNLSPIYVWCENDGEGGDEPGWKLTELRALEDADEESQWHTTPAAANAAAPRRPSIAPAPSTRNGSVSQGKGEEDDSYWAAYDMQASETPAPGPSPAPPKRGAPADPTSSDPDNDYFSRYGSEVQPALDGHDPDEAGEDMPSSTLHGSTFRPVQQAVRRYEENSPEQHPGARPIFRSPFATGNGASAAAAAAASNVSGGYQDGMSMPWPMSQAASWSSLDQLEQRAEALAGSGRAQAAIKMHISNDLKNLFRLARSAGMQRDEIERIVYRELEALKLVRMGSESM